MQAAVEQAQQTSEKLKQQVGELKRKIDEGERTATTLVARKNAATAQRKVAEAMSGVGSADNAFPQLNRFERSVSQGRSHGQGVRSTGLRRQGRRSGNAVRGPRHP